MKIIGIDLGTTNSCVAVIEADEASVILNSVGNRTTPSVVAFKNGELQIGDIAKDQAITDHDALLSIKRYMGTDYRVNIGGETFIPQEIMAMILLKLKKDAEDYLKQKVTQCVISVPSYFNRYQIQATKDAGRIAGFEMIETISDSTAAALAYGLDKEGEHQVLVYDLGGGTFSVSVVELGDGVFEIKSKAGDNQLGGDDFDQAIVNYLVSEFEKESGIDISYNKTALHRLKDASEKAKIELSSMKQTQIYLPFIFHDVNGPMHLNKILTRTQFDIITSHVVERTMNLTRNVLKDASVSTRNIDRVILVGASTRIQAVQNAIKKLINQEPFKGVNPDECVAVGAAIYAGVINSEVKDVVLLEVTPFSLGIETEDGIFQRVIDRNTTLPTSKSQIFSTSVDNQTEVEIHVLLGDNEMARDNTTLGRYSLSDIPPAPSGIPQIEVSFEIDTNGYFYISAEDLGTGKLQRMTIREPYTLSNKEIERMMKRIQGRSGPNARNQFDIDYNFVTRTSEVIKDSENYKEHGLIKKLLPILDNFERATNVEVYNEESRSLLIGMEMVYKQLKEALQEEGIQEIEAEGMWFDPKFHHAISQIDAENYSSNIVVEVMQKGYLLGNRVIRPALVKVTK